MMRSSMLCSKRRCASAMPSTAAAAIMHRLNKFRQLGKKFCPRTCPRRPRSRRGAAFLATQGPGGAACHAGAGSAASARSCSCALWRVAALCWRRQGGGQPGNSTFSFSLRSPGRVPQVGGQGRAGRNRPALPAALRRSVATRRPSFFLRAHWPPCRSDAQPHQRRQDLLALAGMRHAECSARRSGARTGGRQRGVPALCRPSLAVRSTSRRPRRSRKITAAPPPPTPAAARAAPFARTGAGAKEGRRAAPRGRRRTAALAEGDSAAPCTLPTESRHRPGRPRRPPDLRGAGPQGGQGPGRPRPRIALLGIKYNSEPQDGPPWTPRT